MSMSKWGDKQDATHVDSEGNMTSGWAKEGSDSEGNTTDLLAGKEGSSTHDHTYNLSNDPTSAGKESRVDWGDKSKE